MDLTSVPLVLFFLVAVCFEWSAVLCANCANQNIHDCVADLGSLDFTDKEKTCNKLKEMQACLISVESSCALTSEQTQYKTEAWKQMEGIMPICNAKKDECYADAIECMAPFEKKQGEAKTASDRCPVMEKTSTCLKDLVSGCENEETKNLVVIGIDGLVTDGKRWKCTEAGYKISGLSGAGVALQPLATAFLMTLTTGLVAYIL